jgi:hypothetical protein
VEKFDLSKNIPDDLSVIVTRDGILDDAVVTRRHDHHLGGAHQDLLIVFPNERLRSDLDPRHVRRLVENVDVVVGRNAHDGSVAVCDVGGLIFLHRVVVKCRSVAFHLSVVVVFGVVVFFLSTFVIVRSRTPKKKVFGF